ncbi:MAG: DoxX family protein [Acidimicrobiia bacterium]
MFVATVAVCAVLAALLTFSAAQKLGRSRAVVASYEKVGVSPERLRVLATVLLAGAGGILVGLAWPPIGLAAAACLAVYFVAAVGAHVRHHDLANVATPVVLFLLSVASLVMRTVTM